MPLSTYDELKSAVATQLIRTDLAGVIPDFITLAEAEMNRVLRNNKTQSRATALVDTDYTALPTDFREMVSARIRLDAQSSWGSLDPAPQGALDRVSDAPQQPRLYGVYGGALRLFPPPDQTYAVELSYFAKVPALSVSNTSNAVLADHPDAYLYGALWRANLYLHDYAAAEAAKGAFSEAMEEILRERRQPGGQLRTDLVAIAPEHRRVGFDITTGN